MLIVLCTSQHQTHTEHSYTIPLKLLGLGSLLNWFASEVLRSVDVWSVDSWDSKRLTSRIFFWTYSSVNIYEYSIS